MVSAQLRRLLAGTESVAMMEAHSALSARIVERAGLPAVWASGLSISAALGLRDCNEASVTQVLDVLELMADAISIPILVDGDSGFGNFNNARRFVRKLCQRGLAGVVIEDKLFPKTNSFVGDGQPLADLDEVAGKLAAMVEARSDPDFCIVGRTEALVSGLGLDEAIRRAEAYRRAGADAIFIHSKRTTADEVLAFAARWERRCPLVVAPTTYGATPPATLLRAGITTYICANHNLRASITAMQRACERVRADGHAAALEREIAPLSEVFALTRTPELLADEQRFLPRAPAPVGLLLASAETPAVRGMVSALGAANVRPITVVGPIALADVHRIDPGAPVSEARAVGLAARALTGPVVIATTDSVVGDHVIPALCVTPGDLVALVDPTLRGHHAHAVGASPGAPPLLATGAPVVGRFVGVLRASAVGAAWLGEAIAGAGAAIDREDLLGLLHRVALAGHPVRLLPLAGGVIAT